MTAVLPHNHTATSKAAASDPNVQLKSVVDRRVITEFVARQGARGATDAEIAAGCPTVHPNSVRRSRGEAWARDLITNQLGEKRVGDSNQRCTVWHATSKAIKALNMPADSFCVKTEAA